MSAQSQPQPLSSKEQSLFRQVVKNYESKQYKKGLKLAEQILRKNPNNGDTQAMKALLMNSLGQSDEAFALAKVALKNGMKSHTCWHVYGLLWRSNRNWEEAIKAYRFALKLDPENQTIQRDLALMQAQTRDYQGYLQSRKQMLQARPALRQNWTAKAVPHHLAGELEAAERLLKTYEETLKTPPSKSDIEHSEALLYRNTIIAESGDLARALEHLDSIKATNLDRTAVLEMRADYLLRLGRHDDAAAVYRTLLARNSEYRAYYEGMEKARQLAKTDRQARKELYRSYADKDERLDAARRIPLDFLEGDDFREAADHYLRRMLKKGVPSTFNNVKALYQDTAKRGAIQEIVEAYASEKPVNGHAETNGHGETHFDRFEEAVLFFLAQHYNYKFSRDLKRASELTERLIAMKPKTYDYVMTKARIAKHQGNPAEASKLMNTARELDLRDRFINTKCAKYQLRNLENAAAVETMGKFTKNDVVGGTLGDLHEMQSLWFLTEDGESHWRQGHLGRALKRFHAILDIFVVWEEDQFDFHSFSFRKGQIRAYLDMIRWEDRLRDHPFFARAAIDAIKVYLLLSDSPELAQGEGLPYDFPALEPAERKAALKVAKKEHDRVDKEHADRKEADKRVVGKKGNLGVDGEVKKTDDDPRGIALAGTKEPLEAAMKFLSPLMEYAHSNAEAQHFGFEVYIRRRKHFLALKCLLASFKLSPSDPNTHVQAIRLRQALQQLPTSPSPDVVGLANSSLPAPYNDASASLTKINDEFLGADPSSSARILAHARAQYALESGGDASGAAVSRQHFEEAVSRSLDGAPAQQASLADALAGIDLLREVRASRPALADYLGAAIRKFPAAEVSLSRRAGLPKE